MTKKTTKSEVQNYIESPEYFLEKGRLQGYNEIMNWLNSFGLNDLEFHTVAKKMEMEFAITRNQTLTPVAHKIGVAVSA